jgi:hypothetical protein
MIKTIKMNEAEIQSLKPFFEIQASLDTLTIRISELMKQNHDRMFDKIKEMYPGANLRGGNH